MSTTIEPQTQEQQATAPEAPSQITTCPSCGAPAEPGQLMCLDCGARLALDYQRPPSWRLPAAIAGVVVLLAGAAVAFALAQATHNANKATANAPTQPVENAAPADTPPTPAQPTASTPTPAPTGSSATPAPTGSTTTPAPTATAAAAGWPDGKSAFTVILASLPSKAAADAKLSAAKAAGFTAAAILHSDDFPSLRPGWWVVFDGQFDTIGQAQQQAAGDRKQPGFDQAYPRFVSKDANAKP